MGHRELAEVGVAFRRETRHVPEVDLHHVERPALGRPPAAHETRCAGVTEIVPTDVASDARGAKVIGPRVQERAVVVRRSTRAVGHGEQQLRFVLGRVLR